jgi:hypothetical protein
MNEDIMSAETSPPEEASKAEVALATDIMLAMVKTAKGVKMYQASNPLLGKFFQEMTEKISSMLNLYSEYKLDVDRFELSYKGHAVYNNSDTNESMAFRMYSDGIRSIVFSEGVEEWELKEFIEIVGLSQAGAVDDDIVTRMWDKGLPHCSYILEDDFREIDKQIDEQLTGTSAMGRIPPSCLADPFSCAKKLQIVPDHFYTLTAEETSCLQALLSAEEPFNPIDETARILATILSGVAEPELFSAFLEIYLKLTRNLFLAGEKEYSFKLFTFLSRRATAKEPVDDRSRLILDALGRLWTDEAIKGLCKIIDTADAISVDELKTLSTMIGQTSPATLCELLGLVETMKMRKVLIETTSEIAGEKPQIFLPYLSDSRWYLVRNVVLILTQLKNSVLLDQVAALITHRDQRVRKEVLKYLVAVPEPRAKPFILKFLQDEVAGIRIMALQLLGRAKLRFALQPIIAFIDTEVFERMSISEKKAVYETLGELGGVKMLPLFKSMLTRRYLFQRAKEKEAIICAVAGLGKIPGEETLKLLEEAHRSKSPEGREIIKDAIIKVSRQKNTPDSQPQES